VSGLQPGSELSREQPAGAGSRCLGPAEKLDREQKSQRVCGILTAHASSQLVADVHAKPQPTSCKAAATDVFKVAGGPSVAKIRLLTVKVTGNTATTTDTAGPPADRWVRTGPSAWKIASLPPAFG
jgi:hypothetical protein